MAIVKVNINYTISDGLEVKFKSPLDYSSITGLTICYPNNEGVEVTKDFTFVDAHMNDVSQLSDLFTQNAIVKVILDCTNGYAFIQNADTNAYLEEKFDILEKANTDHVDDKNNPHNVTAAQVGARPNTWTPTATEVGADPAGSADDALDAAKKYADEKVSAITPGGMGAVTTTDLSDAISTHNTATDSHNDIRLLIEGLGTRLNTLANSTDEDLDQMAELVAYIKNNKTLIEGITTGKVGVDDIVNNLTTHEVGKPLSAAQGYILKGLIDDLQTALNNHINDKNNPHAVTAAQVGADSAGSAAQALTNAKTYTNNQLAPVQTSVNNILLQLFETGLKLTDVITGEKYIIEIHNGALVTRLDTSGDLEDFTYTEDAGNYTLTGWKETLHGDPSTEMVVPGGSNIIL